MDTIEENKNPWQVEEKYYITNMMDEYKEFLRIRTAKGFVIRSDDPFLSWEESGSANAIATIGATPGRTLQNVCTKYNVGPGMTLFDLVVDNDPPEGWTIRDGSLTRTYFDAHQQSSFTQGKRLWMDRHDGTTSWERIALRKGVWVYVVVVGQNTDAEVFPPLTRAELFTEKHDETAVDAAAVAAANASHALGRTDTESLISSATSVASRLNVGATQFPTVAARVAAGTLDIARKHSVELFWVRLKSNVSWYVMYWKWVIGIIVTCSVLTYGVFPTIKQATISFGGTAKEMVMGFLAGLPHIIFGTENIVKVEQVLEVLQDETLPYHERVIGAFSTIAMTTANTASLLFYTLLALYAVKLFFIAWTNPLFLVGIITQIVQKVLSYLPLPALPQALPPGSLLGFWNPFLEEAFIILVPNLILKEIFFWAAVFYRDWVLVSRLLVQQCLNLWYADEIHDSKSMYWVHSVTLIWLHLSWNYIAYRLYCVKMRKEPTFYEYAFGNIKTNIHYIETCFLTRQLPEFEGYEYGLLRLRHFEVSEQKINYPTPHDRARQGSPIERGPIRYAHHVSMACLSHPICIPNVSSWNAWQCRERLFKRNVPVQSELDWFCKYLRAFLDELPAHAYNYGGNAFEEWNSRFTAGRQKQHVQAYETMKKRFPITQDHIRKCFIKVEILLGWEKVPRIIQDVSRNVHVLLGPFIYRVGKMLMNHWDENSKYFYASGRTPLAAGIWFKQHEHCKNFYVGDMSRFDASIAAPILHEINEWYKLLAPTRDVQECLDKRISATMVMNKFGHKYSVHGQRRSGDADTSVANSIINAAVHTYLLSRCGIQDFHMAVLGDDIVICSNEDLNIDWNWLAKLGFSPKPLVVQDPDFVEFCSKRFWPCTLDNGVRTRWLAAKPGRFLVKLGFAVNDIQFKDKVGSESCENAHVPLVRVVVSKFDRKPQKWNTVAHTGTANDQTFLMFQKIYGMSKFEVLESEKRLSSMDFTKPGYYRFPFTDRIALVDC